MAGLVTALLAVAALAALPALGAGAGMAKVFGIVVPYVAVADFRGGIH